MCYKNIYIFKLYTIFGCRSTDLSSFLHDWNLLNLLRLSISMIPRSNALPPSHQLHGLQQSAYSTLLELFDNTTKGQPAQCWGPGYQTIVVKLFHILNNRIIRNVPLNSNNQPLNYAISCNAPTSRILSIWVILT